nr:RNA-directed DNA polymerase, eukaryota, nucleotide-binding alpha-beta plait domain protein [Tanacetum cinerariifolium]
MAASSHRSSFRSFEDQTLKISHSIYVTNYPDTVNSRDLWKTCSAYGTVVDVFIPLKKSKAGKRFAFIRFIKKSSNPSVPKQPYGRANSYVNVVNGVPSSAHGSLISPSPAEMRESTPSLSHPPGYTPVISKNRAENAIGNEDIEDNVDNTNAMSISQEIPVVSQS